MANYLSMLMLVFTVVLIFMSHTVFSQESGRYPLTEDDYVPIPDYIEPPSGYKLDLKDVPMGPIHFRYACFGKLESDCGIKIQKDMEDNTTTPLTIECCIDLLKIGRECHLAVAEDLTSELPYSMIASNAVSKSKHTWKDCVRRVGSQIGAPQQSQELDRYSLQVPEAYSPATKYKMDDDEEAEEIAFREACLKKMESDCGRKILTDMEDETTTQLTNECCLDLVNIGRDCQIIVAELMARSSKAVSKSKHTWKDCLRRFGSQIGAPFSLE